ncbi:glycosyltransferase [Paradesertivirga mongoliensis]|uniref:Glycosyltransferase n=1 Tax=Paradesertivirga mongoliensis TaxID=2100740 RepID=A0ABW4ZGP0_9SPHI|nr:glycosyltransferase [Pedobacter mongoliensis]
MELIEPINLFYEEPDPDRWVKYDRYPRKIIRRLLRGNPRPGGVMMVALELMHGLRKLGIPYRFNDFDYIKNHTDSIACIIGKPQLLDKFEWKNPIIFGAGIFSHPVDQLDLLEKYTTIKKILVPGPWMKSLFDSYYGPENVSYWPVGIDSEKWHPALKKPELPVDFLIYDKIRWEHSKFVADLIAPVEQMLEKRGLTHETIRYGQYKHQDLEEKLSRCKAVIFLCEHETQGLAYQQILATDTPILAWDRGGFWQDPAYFPHRAKYGPVTSVPYWDEKCGVTFPNNEMFPEALDKFLEMYHSNSFSPRAYIMDNLTLEKCAEKYIKIYKEVENAL